MDGPCSAGLGSALPTVIPAAFRHAWDAAGTLLYEPQRSCMVAPLTPLRKVLQAPTDAANAKDSGSVRLRVHVAFPRCFLPLSAAASPMRAHDRPSPRHAEALFAKASASKSSIKLKRQLRRYVHSITEWSTSCER